MDGPKGKTEGGAMPALRLSIQQWSEDETISAKKPVVPK